MSQFYTVRNIDYVFKELDLNTLDVLGDNDKNIDLDIILDFNSKTTPLEPYWPKLATEFIAGESQNSPIPDISYWLEASLVLSPRAYRLLGDSLKQCGELLPVEAEGETYYIFNCLTVGEDDKDNCSFKQVEGIDFELERLTFKDSNLDYFIFKSEMDSYRNLFCSERFKQAVEKFGLTGISFDESLIDPVPEGLVY